MTDYKIEKIIETLLKSPLTGYYIAQKTGLTEQTILNYRKKKTIPTNANAKLLEYFFDSQRSLESSNQSIIGDNNKNNLLAGGGVYNHQPEIDELKKQLVEKDKIINNLIRQQEKLINKLTTIN